MRQQLPTLTIWRSLRGFCGYPVEENNVEHSCGALDGLDLFVRELGISTNEQVAKIACERIRLGR